MKRNHLINNQIKATMIRLILENGEMYGEVSLEEGLEIAGNKELDLMQLSSVDENIAVCKLVNYGKLKYEEKKHKKEKHREKVKEIKYNFNIFEHDLEVKHRKVREFLLKRNKVKYILEMRNRQSRMIDVGEERINDNLEAFRDLAKWEKPKCIKNPRITRFITVLFPLKVK